MNKWGLSQECKDSSKHTNQSMWYTILTNWRRKTIWSSQQMQKKLLTKFNTHLGKNPPESRHRGNLPQHNKGYIWQTHSQHRSRWWKTETISSKIRKKTRLSTLTTIIQHSFGRFSHSNQRRKRNKMNPNWKRRSKTVTVCRWHDTIHRESLKCHQKTTRANQWIW